MPRLGKAFVAGLAAILPVAITAYIVYWLGTTLEAVCKKLLLLVLHKDSYWWGMGLVTGMLIAVLVGLLLKAWFVQKVYNWGQDIAAQIPVIKTIYGAVQNLTNFFANAKEKAMGQVVTVRLGETDLRLLGLVTREDFSSCPEGIANDAATIAVYLPMSYQMGGFTVMVPRSQVQPVDMQVQDAMQYVLTAGMATKRRT